MGITKAKDLVLMKLKVKDLNLAKEKDLHLVLQMEIGLGK